MDGARALLREDQVLPSLGSVVPDLVSFLPRLISFLREAGRFRTDDESLFHRERIFLSEEESFLSRVGRGPVGVSGNLCAWQTTKALDPDALCGGSATCALICEVVRQT